ncbi:MAG: hemerythrin domain-containing protein [Paracoccus sp. (in: a-proteobacteria)]|uniref:hemerythrin domain-containing protein n=1 Tax=Paracoccus sp. TaxID=267 RepID=UPI00391DBDA6
MTPEELEDEAARPAAPAYPGMTRAKRAHGRRLALIHDMYRAEMEAVAALLTEIRAKTADARALPRAVSAMGLARNFALFGTACGRDCALLQNHHDIEEQWMFPALARRGGGPLAPVIARLKAEHKVIHRLIDELDMAAHALVSDQSPARFDDCAARFAALDRAIRSHFGYEERVLEEPLGALGVPV